MAPVTEQFLQQISIETILNKLPSEAKKWAESLPWSQRRYVLSLCHLLCAATADIQAEFLDEYTANGLIAKLVENREIQQKVKDNLQKFHIQTDLSEPLVRNYIRQFYVHSVQDARCQTDLFLESALRIVASTEERNNIFNYILGFELIKMLFNMSWLQHEKLYRLQRNQEEFLTTYIKPIQHAHRVNQIIVPKDEKLFFARRDYFVQKPGISDKKLIELAIATFTTEVTTNFGFSIIRHPQSLAFNYQEVFVAPQDLIFPG
ncbi:MAG: cobyrinic acid a,c-diamide synthase [Leptolyngbyaceae cyanobacterium SU_3_3]|nr:cobyrinic acid a,c-diamide synthase [Leptolyngbyaceae cyanobacterium SU_3_3]NJR51676.1 cobyrinic acid a,c-diamide synthase [Leptolyngbyaceae cyanobacterium CSU_1_3]